jgi:alginate O-acetyltransferase complex protein AlgI
LWHGDSWNFAIWGLFHGLFLVAERAGLGRAIARCWSPLRHAYTLAAVIVGWVFFRASDLTHALAYLRAMLGAHGASVSDYPWAMYLDSGLALAIVAGLIGSTPIPSRLARHVSRQFDARPRATLGEVGCGLARLAVLGLVLVASSSVMLASTYNPFIYFRF